MNKDLLKMLVCIATIIIYLIIMKIKNYCFKKVSNKTSHIISFVINVIVLLGSLLVIALIANDFKFHLVIDYGFKILTNPKLFEIVLTFIIIAIVSTTLYSIIRTILVKPYKIAQVDEKRKATIVKVALSFIRYVIYIADMILILYFLGIDVTPILTGLGLAGVVIGLGAQKLITDFINGMFIIFERHFDVGDTVEVGGFKGIIIDIGLKTTKIRNWRGEVKIVANGEILQLINYSLNNSIALVEFSVRYNADYPKIMDLLNNDLGQRMKDYSDIISAPQVMGVTNLDNNAVTIRVIATTQTEKHYGIERAMRLEIVKMMQENNIEFPYQQVVVDHGGDHNE